jgi:LacI family transcriptional regulator
MVTIDDVAKHAGVSIATVSRVINGSYRILTTKYEKVLKAMDELGYKSSKRQFDNKQILIISSMINEQFIKYFEDSAGKYNLSTLYKYIPESDISLDNLPNKNDYDGVIILDAAATEDTYEKLRSICPVVLCRVQYNYPNTISVSVDDEQAAYDVTSYFIKKGRRKIAMICDIDRSFSSDSTNHIKLRDRQRLLNGYYLALLENDIPIDPELIATSDDFAESRLVEEMFRKLFSDPERCPDAVFSGSIVLAFRLSDIAKECGKRVPEDIAFGTCGGIFDYQTSPHMTYAGQPLDRLADITVQTLNSIMKGEIPADKQHHIYIEHILYPMLD